MKLAKSNRGPSWHTLVKAAQLAQQHLFSSFCTSCQQRKSKMKKKKNTHDSSLLRFDSNDFIVDWSSQTASRPYMDRIIVENSSKSR
mmetsp:Transcript_3376/g.5975  ORF Transcript_3376/g.5975 Transcript_3376/m.5975 type:complete len:87 (-) Transcript_3376:521-781(-)